MTTLAILGDSAAHGIGDEVQKDVYRGFGHYLREALGVPEAAYVNVSRPGARAAEVNQIQVPKAIEARADVAVVVVGGNDVLRNDFDPVVLYSQIRDTVVRLRAAGCTVVSMNLHDCVRVAPLPRSVGRVLSRRVEAVNCVFEALARDITLPILDIHRDERVYDKTMWHIDRLHPSRRGHQALAAMFGEILGQHGLAVAPIQVGEHEPSRRIDDISWMLRKGTPWFLKRSFDLLPAIVILTLIDKLGLIDRVAPRISLDMLARVAAPEPASA